MTDDITYRTCVLALLFVILGSVIDPPWSYFPTVFGVALAVFAGFTMLPTSVRGYKVDDWLDPGSTKRRKQG